MSTTTIIRTSTTSTTGYELVIKDELGNETVQPIQSTYKNEPYTLVLPENPAGRKYMNSKKVDAANGEVELVTINRNPDSEHQSQSLTPIKFPKSHYEIHDQLNEEELDELKCFEDAMTMYMEMMERAWDRLHPKKAPMTEEQKLRNRIAKAQAALEELLKGAQA